MRWLLGLLVVLTLVSPLFAAGRPMTVDDLLAVKSVSDPQVSPDGKLVVYVVSEVDRETNKSTSDLWLVPVDGGEPKRLTTAPGNDSHPRWSPDGKTIAFASDRGGSTQVWLLPVDGGEARALTKLPIDISGPIWSPRGDKIAFAAEVYPGTTPEETVRRDKEKAESKSKARVFDSLMIRHWTSWDEGKRSHLFICDAKTGEAKDLTPNLDVNTPPRPFGGSSDYTFSPDGNELAFTAEPRKNPAWSTNTDIWVVSSEGGDPKNLTAENRAADAQPSYSPNGTFLAYVSQARAGFEADLWVLKLRHLATGRISEIGVQHDRPIHSFSWTDSHGMLATIDDQGTESIVKIHFEWKDDGSVSPGTGFLRVVAGGMNSSVQSVHRGGETLAVYVRNTADRPSEIYRSETRMGLPLNESGAGNEPIPLTHHNDSLIAELDLPKAEGFTFEGADGDRVSGWLLRPPGFVENKTYPVLFLIHGGPQGSWHDEWHARWNYQLFAAPGYALIAINPRGSTGYGQKFTDQISRDWTGRVYEDLMKGLDHALKTYRFLDESRMAAAGGSYGGFMVNWIAGHSDRFQALISHAGIYDLTSMNVTTEELWFPEWEFGGSPWETPDIHLKMSPSSYVQNFRTPTLVLHGALDFRVPDGQGLAMFTALQRMGVPSRFVFFPDEGHWVLKPANRVVWWNEVHAWLAKYIGTKPR